MVTDKKSNFGVQLQMARKRAGVSQRELGDAVGVSGSAVAHWEHGQRGGVQMPAYARLIALAQYLDISIAELTGIDGPKKNAQNELEAEVLFLLRQMSKNQQAATAAMLRAMLMKKP